MAKHIRKNEETSDKYEENKEESFTTTLKNICSEKHIEELETFTIEDHFFRRDLKEFSDSNSITLIQKTSPGFICTLREFKEYSSDKKRFLMNDFYIWQRKRLNILVDENNQPIGGQWSYDSENRKKTPKSYTSPKYTKQTPTQITKEVIKMVEEEFFDHKRSEFHKTAVEMEQKASYCKLCRKQLTSLVQLKEHLTSKPHKERLDRVRENRRMGGNRGRGRGRGPGQERRQWS
jgi:deoxyribodipyrimidine photolyase-like uncharacterized protein